MSNYVKNNLIQGKVIAYLTSYHWIIFLSVKSLFTLFLSPIIAVYSDEFVITNKRVIIKTGLIARHTLELNLTKIESVNINQNILGRILGYGSIQIIGTGCSKETFINNKNSMEFRKKFQELS
jgi:uncharacterized membrane protein YdbT with pleckstrin-like domain